MNFRKIGGGFTFCWGWVGGRLGVGRIITELNIILLQLLFIGKTLSIGSVHLFSKNSKIKYQIVGTIAPAIFLMKLF